LLHGIAVAAVGLHAYRSRECVAAEQRQPNGQKYCSKFSWQAQHGHSLAKNSPIVNKLRCITALKPMHRNLFSRGSFRLNLASPIGKRILGLEGLSGIGYAGGTLSELLAQL
jgi:hypothetical protein